MAELDWTDAIGSATTAAVARAVSAGYPKPNGGGSFAYGFNSLGNAPGAVIRYTGLVNFAPTAKGGDISCTIQRGLSGGKTGFSAFLFFCMTGTNVADNAYILGLADGDPSHFVLRKGDLSSGLPDVIPGTQGVLRQSTDSFVDQAYYHLRLECVANTNGDVVINCYQSDLTLHTVGSPAWVAIPGLSQFIDDNAGILSGSPPYTSGYCGYGFRSTNIARRAYFDHIRITAQN